MGFYSPATLVKDAQRHGLHVLPIDITRSNWSCTLEAAERRKNAAPGVSPGLGTGKDAEPRRGDRFDPQSVAPPGLDLHDTRTPASRPGLHSVAAPRLRIGLRYVRGLRQPIAETIVRERTKSSFTSIDDLVRRVPELQKDELVMLAEIGALNFLNPQQRLHRRDALWQVERAARRSGPLLEELPSVDEASPLQMMTAEERIVADFYGTGMTVGPHPMSYCRAEMNALGVKRASDLRYVPNGEFVRIAGCVIARQRPGTARGFVFLSLEDETGISNAILTPDVFQQNRRVIVDGRFLLLEGRLQNVDNVISVKVSSARTLSVTQAETHSHDFH